MENFKEISENIKRHRYLAKLTQEQLARMSGIALPTIKKIEKGESGIRTSTIQTIAKALGVEPDILMQEAPRLRTIRFRSCKNLRSKEGVISYIINRLETYNKLEELGSLKSEPVYQKAQKVQDPLASAAEARRLAGLDKVSPVANLTHTIGELGIKLFNVTINTEKFFGLSVGEADGGPAIIVNTNPRIAYEQMVFSIAHELGHFFMHADTKQKINDEIIWAEEDAADLFASHFLMPEEGFRKEWAACEVLHWTDKVIKVKHIFGIHYKTVLHRLGDFGTLYKRFLKEYKEPLKNGRDPKPLPKVMYIEERLYATALKAIAQKKITEADAAEMLGIEVKEIKRLVKSDL